MKEKSNPSFLGLSLQAKCKVRNLEFSKRKLLGFDFLPFPSLSGAKGVGREEGRERAREGGGKRGSAEHAQCTLSFSFYYPRFFPSSTPEKRTVPHGRTGICKPFIPRVRRKRREIKRTISGSVGDCSPGPKPMHPAGTEPRAAGLGAGLESPGRG